MKKANPGKDRKDWKPPEGYKSALGRARDAARAKEEKNKKIAALEHAEDTASDDDCDFGSEHDFKLCALRRRTPPMIQSLPPAICAVNRFEGLREQQEYDSNILDSLNHWAHRFCFDYRTFEIKRSTLYLADELFSTSFQSAHTTRLEP